MLSLFLIALTALAVLVGVGLATYFNRHAEPLPDYADPDVHDTPLEQYL